MKSIVVAYDLDRTIGRKGDLPWAGELPADMRHFTRLTKDQTVIMGRHTYDSLPEAYKPLPHRQNIVLSLSTTALQGVEIARSLEEAYSLAKAQQMIIGGSEVFRQALPDVTTIFATEIETHTINGDAFFPMLVEDEWDIADVQRFEADERNKYDHSFVTYVRCNLMIGSDFKE